MKQFNIKNGSSSFTNHAVLAALGQKLQRIQLFEPIRSHVKIQQKTVKYTPADKLEDVWLSMLTGARGLVETNKRLRPDRALQRAFGRSGCAEQSTLSETLNAATPENVPELEQALTTIYRRFSRGYRHDYTKHWQILDADTSGLPAGRNAELCTKGYFARQRNRRGRQLGRVIASRYDEIVTDQVYAGKVQLTECLQPLLQHAAQVLELDAAKRARTILRIDAGGGSDDDVNWMLDQDYQLITKAYSSKRAAKLAQSVRAWYPDPKVKGREVGLVTQPHPYARATTQIAVRSPKKDGRFGYAVLITTLSATDILVLVGQPRAKAKAVQPVLLAYVAFYDARSGGAETQIKGDKQGLGLTKRNKKKMAAQQIVVLLAQLAHNVIIWARQWLAGGAPQLQHYGIVRMLRDVFTMRGRVQFEVDTTRLHIVLDQADRLAKTISVGLRRLLKNTSASINLGEI
ncbi:MAG: transposase [Anaerolineae bacterium]|nr:transposase [Anaerolineae bacterium]